MKSTVPCASTLARSSALLIAPCSSRAHPPFECAAIDVTCHSMSTVSLARTGRSRSTEKFIPSTFPFLPR